MLTKKKKIIILSAMTLLLVITGCINVALNNNLSKTVTTTAEIQTNAQTNNTFFADYRANRVQTRNQEVDYLNAIIASESTTSEAREVAENKKIEIIKTMEAELVMEGLIIAAGFPDAVVTSTSNNINIIVKSSNLQTKEVSQIVSIIKEQTGKDIDNIKIFPVE